MSAALGERDGGESKVGVCLSFPVKVFVDIKGVKGSIKSAKARAKAQAAFDVSHEGHEGHEEKEVGDVGAIEGLGEFGEDELTLRHVPPRAAGHLR